MNTQKVVIQCSHHVLLIIVSFPMQEPVSLHILHAHKTLPKAHHLIKGLGFLKRTHVGLTFKFWQPWESTIHDRMLVTWSCFKKRQDKPCNKHIDTAYYEGRQNGDNDAYKAFKAEEEYCKYQTAMPKWVVSTIPNAVRKSFYYLW